MLLSWIQICLRRTCEFAESVLVLNNIIMLVLPMSIVKKKVVFLALLSLFICLCRFCFYNLIFLCWQMGNDENDDLISGLPDDILSYVLCFMDTRTAARTSLLSKRWKHIWTCLIHLNIEVPKLYHRPVLPSDMVRYCNWINNIVASNRANYLDSFRIVASLDESFAAHLQNWVEFAFLRNVRNLEVNLSFKTCSIRSLNIIFTNPALEYLQLTSVTIDGPLLEWILSNCLNLQRFSIHRCKISSGSLPFASSESTKLVVSSLTLKRLEFYKSISAYYKEIHMCASNLVYFMFVESKFVNVVYHKVPSLVEAVFGDSYCRPIFQNVGFLSAFSSQLEKLCLSWDEVSHYNFYMVLVGYFIKVFMLLILSFSCHTSISREITCM